MACCWTTHVCLAPAVIEVAPVSKMTGAGVVWLAMVLSPSWPSILIPQQAVVPFCLRAHVWYSPVLVAVTPVSPTTMAGMVRLVVVASPTCP